MIDKKVVALNNGENEVSVLVYLRRVMVKNNKTAVKAFCRVLTKDRDIDAFDS